MGVHKLGAEFFGAGEVIDVDFEEMFERFVGNMPRFAISTIFRKLRLGVIFDYTPRLRPFGGKNLPLADFALMFLNCSERSNIAL